MMRKNKIGYGTDKIKPSEKIKFDGFYSGEMI